MFDNYFRNLLIPLYKSLISHLPLFLLPNHLTLISFFLGLFSCLLIVFQSPIPALLLFLLSRIFDGLDGSLARARQLQTDFGGYFDILCDFIIYAMIPISFCLVRWEIKLIFIGMVLEASFFINAAGLFYLSGLMIKKGLNSKFNSLILPKGLIEGFETYIFYCIFYLFPNKLVKINYKSLIFHFFNRKKYFHV